MDFPTQCVRRILPSFLRLLVLGDIESAENQHHTEFFTCGNSDPRPRMIGRSGQLVPESELLVEGTSSVRG